MKLKLSPENPLEWIALKMNLAPLPLVETQIYFTVARIIMAAAELGIYEAIGKGSKTAEEIAKTKMPDLTAADLDAAVRTIAGSARSMGIEVEGI